MSEQKQQKVEKKEPTIPRKTVFGYKELKQRNTAETRRITDNWINPLYNPGALKKGRYGSYIVTKPLYYSYGKQTVELGLDEIISFVNDIK